MRKKLQVKRREQVGRALFHVDATILTYGSRRIAFRAASEHNDAVFAPTSQPARSMRVGAGETCAHPSDVPDEAREALRVTIVRRGSLRWRRIA